MFKKPSSHSLALHQHFRFPVNVVDEKFNTLYVPERGHSSEQMAAILFWKEVWKNARYVCNCKIADDETMQSHHWRDETQDILKAAEYISKSDWETFRQKAYPRVRGEFEHFHEDVALLRGIMRNALPTCAQLPDGSIYVINLDKINNSSKKTFFHDMDSFIETHDAEDKISLLEALDAVQEHLDGKPIASECVLSLLSNRVDTIISADQENLAQYPEAATFDIHQNYWDYRFFNDWAGRDTVIVDAAGLPSLLKAFKEKGHNEVFVKHAKSKCGVWRISLEKADDSIVMLHHLLSIMEWMFLGNAYFAVQPIVEFRNEYRFFIVGGEIIKGTPVRRSDCVYDDDGSLISPYICKRHDGHERVYAPEQVNRYKDVVDKMLESAKENIMARDISIVIDVGEDENGRILPIEINTVMRAGAYGFNHAKLIDHIVAVARQP